MRDDKTNEQSNDLPKLSSAISIIESYQHKKLKPMTDIKEKILAVSIFCVLVIVSMVLLFDEPKYKFIAALMFTVFFMFYTGYLIHMLKAKYLHRVKIVTTYIEPDFGLIVFPLQIKPYPTKPILSMSEVFAIRGSQMSHMFGGMCFFMGGVVITAIYSYVSNLHHFGDIDTFWNNEYLEIFLSISSVVATPLIGVFDLNPNDKIHQIFHYLGVVFMMISVFPYAIQSGFDAPGKSDSVVCHLFIKNVHTYILFNAFLIRLWETLQHQWPANMLLS
eukprot:367770_1